MVENSSIGWQKVLVPVIKTSVEFVAGMPVELFEGRIRQVCSFGV
jgi:hypothetical protein